MSPRSQDALGRRTGRFDPSEPLHMTTRHAAKKGRPNGTPSINGSIEDDESRRGSLDSFRAATGQSPSGQPSPRARRVSGTSANVSTDINMSLDARKSHGKRSAKDASLSVSPNQDLSTQATQATSRKRKRTYTPPRLTAGNLQIANSAGSLDAAENDLNSMTDIVIVVPEDKLSNQESPGSSSGQDVDRYVAAAQSTEETPAATPMGSEPVSPVSEETNPTPRYPAKHTDVVMADADHPVEDDMDDMDQDDVPAAAEDADDLADAEDDEDHVVAGPRRRYYGRRRAEHHEIDIEVIMRRQLQLKSSYRVIARSLKPLLAEIASKTLEELEASSVLHQQVVEYEGTEEYAGVQKLLDTALANRKRQLEAQVAYNREQLRKRFVAEKEVRRGYLTYEVDNMRQKRVDDMEYELLSIARRVQLEKDSGQQVTDDEEGEVLPRPRHTGYRLERGAPLDSRHESRSRKALETERAIADMQRRFEMHQMMQDAEENDDMGDNEPFTVMDSTAREAAHARREGITNTNILADAAAEVDRLANIPVIPNHQAFGLQLLGDLASRPSLRATVFPPPATPRRLGEPFASTYRQGQMRPSAHIPMYQNLSQISPDTAQWVEHAIPHSPQRYPTRANHEEPRWGASMRSPPTMGDSRLSTFPALASLLQSPSLNLPGRHDAYRSQHHRQQSHDGVQHHRNPSQNSTHHQRQSFHGSRSGARSEHDQTRPTLPGAASNDHSAWEGSPRSQTGDAESHFVQRFESRGESEHGLQSIEDDPQIKDSDLQSMDEDPRTMDEDPQIMEDEPQLMVDDPQSMERDSQSMEHGSQNMEDAASSAQESTEREQSAAVKDLEAEATAHDESETQGQPNAEDGAQSEVDGVEADREIEIIDLASTQVSEAQVIHDDTPEQHSSEGAADERPPDDDNLPDKDAEKSGDQAAARKSRRRPPCKPFSRESSPGHSTDVSGSQDGDRGPSRQGQDGTQHLSKTSKAERNGLSRKAHKESRQRGANKRMSDALRPGVDGNGAQMFRFRLNQVESTKPASTVSVVSVITPAGYSHPAPFYPPVPTYPPLPSYNQPPPPPGGYPPMYGPYPPQYFPWDAYYHDAYVHRNSLPGAGGPPPPWAPGYYGPGYSHPSMGPPPDNWAAAANGSEPPHPSQASQPSQSSPAAGSQYGGPAIAPATPDPRNPYGAGSPGAAHPPAFAQQQRNAEGSRRRTQSDAPRQTKFHHYAGPRK